MRQIQRNPDPGPLSRQAGRHDPMIDSPLRWPGGKSRLRRRIAALLPAHETYVEPFAGAAWVLLARPPGSREIINDLDPEVANFWRVLQLKCDELIAAFDLELVSRAEFDRLAAQDPEELSPVARAHRFYFLTMAGWGGEYGTPRFSTTRRPGGHGNRLIGALLRLDRKLRPVSRRIAQVGIEQAHWTECVDRHDRPGVCLYVDPPYPNNKVNYRRNMRSPAAHDRLAERLQRCRASWALSSPDDQATRERYRGYDTWPLRSASGMPDAQGGRHRNAELLIVSHPI